MNGIKSLERISVENVVSYLQYNYELCVQYKWNIPKNIADLIFDYAIKYRKPLMDSDVYFFQSDISELSEFRCSKGRFRVWNYDFLIDHQFDNFVIRNVDKFEIDEELGEVYTKNLTIRQRKLADGNLDEFLCEVLKVEKSISAIIFYKSKTLLTGIYHLIQNSSLTLTNLSIKLPVVNKRFLKIFLLLIPKLKKLEKLELSFHSRQTTKNYFGNLLLNSILPLSKNLKSLQMERIPFSYSPLIKFLEISGKVQELDVPLKNSIDENSESDVLRSLRKNPLLEKINLDIEKINDDVKDELTNLMKNSKYLKTIDIHFPYNERPTLDNILESMENLAKNLQSFNLSDMYKEKNLGNLCKVFAKCQSLTKIDITCYCNVKEMLPSLERAIIQSKYTLREMYLPGFKGDEFISCLLRLSECKHIEILYFERCENNEQIENTLRKLIENCQKTLKSFSWFGHSPKLSFGVEFLKSLSKCPFLVKIEIFDLDLIGKLNYLINKSSDFLENFDELCLMSVLVNERDIVQLSNVLKNMKSLRHLDLRGTFASEASSIYFCRQVKNIRSTLDNFSPPQPLDWSD